MLLLVFSLKQCVATSQLTLAARPVNTPADDTTGRMEFLRFVNLLAFYFFFKITIYFYKVVHASTLLIKFRDFEFSLY